MVMREGKSVASFFRYIRYLKGTRDKKRKITLRIVHFPPRESDTNEEGCTCVSLDNGNVKSWHWKNASVY